MSATHPALEAAIKEQDADQLITYAWEPDADEILATTRQGLLRSTDGAMTFDAVSGARLCS